MRACYGPMICGGFSRSRLPQVAKSGLIFERRWPHKCIRIANYPTKPREFCVGSDHVIHDLAAGTLGWGETGFSKLGFPGRKNVRSFGYFLSGINLGVWWTDYTIPDLQFHSVREDSRRSLPVIAYRKDTVRSPLISGWHSIYGYEEGPLDSVLKLLPMDEKPGTILCNRCFSTHSRGFGVVVSRANGFIEVNDLERPNNYKKTCKDHQCLIVGVFFRLSAYLGDGENANAFALVYGGYMLPFVLTVIGGFRARLSAGLWNGRLVEASILALFGTSLLGGRPLRCEKEYKCEKNDFRDGGYGAYPEHQRAYWRSLKKSDGTNCQRAKRKAVSCLYAPR